MLCLVKSHYNYDEYPWESATDISLWMIQVDSVKKMSVG